MTAPDPRILLLARLGRGPITERAAIAFLYEHGHSIADATVAAPLALARLVEEGKAEQFCQHPPIWRLSAKSCPNNTKESP